ncbi:MAG: uroporphyrinogen decarboxylase [Gammaproteobacteria bacterium]|nr:uroporphyrinogen decarboxylase [Gammaproteobacteria bacterium]MCY4275866.1 uroporphyrinogen decarboxylase [Gammaproteobacteria bacterium]
MKDRYLRALKRQPVDRTPIWIMRQAGRYLPEYREVRKKAGDFLSLCKNPELACLVTLQPLERFDLDAAIIFSDILTIPDAMGLGLTLEEGVGPRFNSSLRTTTDIEKLPEIDIETQLDYVIRSIALARHELADRVPLIGFSGSPWTLATYMVEGGSSKDFKYVKGMMHDRPDSADLLMRKLTQSVTDYLHAQVTAGAQSLMIFDTWGGLLAEPDYERFSLEPMTWIVQNLKSNPATFNIPITLFTKGGGNWLEKIAASGCDAVGLDWTVSLASARSRIGHLVALQGNMDPTVLYASPEKVANEAVRILDEYGKGDGHVFNLGHGIHPGVEPDRVQVLVDTVHRESAR